MTTHLKTCPACGKEYETKREAQKYCSKECANLMRVRSRRETPLKKKTCAICLSGFWGMTTAKYCSPACEAEAMRRKKTADKARTKREGTALSLSAIAAMAREEGLSYGQYVAKHGI